MIPHFRHALLTAISCALPTATFANEISPRTLDSILVTASAPSAPLTWITDPKHPRQPVPASDGADYLKTIPGFSVIRQGGSNGDPVLRGMFGSRLNILSNDGTLIGACPSRMDNPLSYIAPETFDRLTIIKGPQTVLWGPGASAGTIRFERETPYFNKPGVNMAASTLISARNRNDQALNFSAGHSLGYARISTNRSESGDYKDGNGRRVHSSWDKWNTDLTLGVTPNPDTVLELSAGRGNAQTRYAGRGMDGSLFERTSYGLRFETSNLPGAWHSLGANLYHNYVDHVMDNYTLRPPHPASAMPMPMATHVDRRTQGGRFAARWQSDVLTLDFGLDAHDSRHRRRSGMGRGNYRAQPLLRDAELRNFGVFSELAVDQSTTKHWIAGLRLDHSKAHDHRMSAGGGHGGGGMIPNPTRGQARKETLKSAFIRHEHDLSPAMNWYIGLGHSERMPDYWELFSPGSGQVGSPNAFAGVKPEHTTQLDLGLHYKTKHFNTWVSAYAGRLDDYILISYYNHMMGLTTTARNIDARIAGSEAGLEWTPTEGLNFSASVAYAWGENHDDNRALPQMPPLDARLSVAFEGRRWSAGMLLRGVASQGRIAANQGNIVGRDLGKSPGFATIAFNGGYRINDTLQVTTGIDNVFNRFYSEHLNLAGNADFGYPAHPIRIAEPGRTAWLKVNYRF